MRNIIPKYTAPDSGNLQDDIVDNTNSNTLQLYDRSKAHGSRIQKFLMKLRSDELRYEKIRIAMIGDSILGTLISSGYDLQTYFEDRYPNKIFEIKYLKLGGTGAPYFMAGTWDLVHYNADLTIIMEWEGDNLLDYLENIFKLFRNHSSSDLAVIPWTIVKVDMDLLSAQDISGFVSSNTMAIKRKFMTFCSKYNAQVIDTHQPWYRVLLDGTETSDTLTQDNVHPSNHAMSYWYEEYDKHFLPIWDNEQTQYNGDGKYFKTIFFREAVELPDITEITKSGTWTAETIDTDKTIAVLKSSNAVDYIEFKIYGIGFELLNFGNAVGEFGILIDGDVPSTFMKNYTSNFEGNSINKPYKIIIDSNILDDDEAERAFLVTMGTIVRDGGGVITSAPYTLDDATNVVTVGSGNFTQDETFPYDGGSLTIPKEYAGFLNLRDTDEGIITGATFSFKVKKMYSDVITQANDSLTQITRFTGLENKGHTIRLTVNSGTVSLDNIMELK